MTSDEALRHSIESHLDSIQAIKGLAGAILDIAISLDETLQAGGKVLTCGNGGSAAESLHLAEEMIGCFSRKRKPLAAVCLAADPTAITCIANDYGYEELFARQVEGLGRKGDALVALSTSGHSPNILRALERARKIGLTTIGFLGKPGSPAEAICDHVLNAPGQNSAHIQEIQLVATHLILEYLDDRF